MENLVINSQDPFLTHNKWNDVIEHSKNLEGILKSILGKKFKGTYNSSKNYEINDYVWLENKAYIITDKKEPNSNLIQKTNIKNAYFLQNSFLCLQNSKLSIVTENKNKIISNIPLDKFAYYDSKDFVIGYKNNNKGAEIFKIYLNGNVEIINANFSFTIKDIFLDDFSIYILTKENEIHKFNNSNSDLTLYEKINFVSNYNLISITANDKYLIALNSNNEILFINKAGGLKSFVNVSEYITNILESKIQISDNFTLYLFDGNNDVAVFILNDNILNHSYKINTKINKVESITCSHKMITLNNDSIIFFTLASKYEVMEVPLKMLLNNISTIEICEAYFALDFSKGQLVSNGKEEKEPKNFIFDSSKTNNWYYNDGTNNIQFVPTKGIQLHDNILIYNNLAFENKTIIIEFTKASPSVNFLKIPINGKITELIACKKNILEPFKTIYEIKTNKIEVNVVINGETTELFDLPLGTISGTETIFSSSNNILLNKIIVTDLLDQIKIDFLANSSYIIPGHFKNTFLPNEYNNQNGVKYIKTANKSILNSSTGIKVNLSSNPNLNDEEIAFNTAGANKLLITINEMKKQIENDFASKQHSHNFTDINNVPTASVFNAGMVQLSENVDSASKVTAPTSSALKTVKNKAETAQSTAEQKLSKTPGEVNDWYQKHTKVLTGDLLTVLKTGKTGFFSGINLTNGYPTNEWVHYIAFSHPDETGYTGIIAMNFSGSTLGFASISNGIFSGWATTWNNKNFNPDNKANVHNHPYLSDEGGTLKNNLQINGGQLILNKKDNISIIKFLPISNNPGYIEHSESGNKATMKFSASNNSDTIDSFSFGSGEGNGYKESVNITTSGNIHSIGNIHAVGEVSNSSDKRLKENIKVISFALEKVLKINGVTFDRKDINIRQTGLIAQDVVEVMPEAVIMNEEGYLSVNYGSLVGLLVEAIKELNKKIDKV